jgi:hypothetical protein
MYKIRLSEEKKALLGRNRFRSEANIKSDTTDTECKVMNKIKWWAL